MRKVLVLILFLFISPATAQDVPKARELAKQLLAALEPLPPVISTPDGLLTAIALAGPNDVLVLSSSLVYPTSIALTRPMTLRAEGLPLSDAASRMELGTPLPLFQDGITVSGDNITLIGLDVRKKNPLTDIVTVKGANVTLDRLRILGDSMKGAKRGVAANGNGNVRILRSYIDDCFQAYPGNDSQAIVAWDMAPGLLIQDNFLRGGSETVMMGGADSSTAERMPSDVTIRGNTITKRPEWQTLLVGVKNTLELKAARNVLIEDNDIQYSWGGHGQDGYLFLVTVRNQDGRAPWSTVQNVVFRNNRLSHASAAFNILGIDNVKETKSNMPTPIGTVRPSVKASGLTFADNVVMDIDPTLYTGSNRLILIGGSPLDVTIDGNVFSGQHLGSQLYLYGSLPASLLHGLIVTNNTWPAATYGIKGDGTAPGAATWTAYVESGTLSGNVVH